MYDFDIAAPDPSVEDEDDLAPAASKSVTDAVVTGTDWTTETILNQLNRGNIELNPRFQRRDAWQPVRKSRFIESLFLGLPIPQIVLAERPSHRGSYLVLDGKQRLLTLRQFASVSGGEFEPLKLSSLEIRAELNGQTLQSIETDGRFATDLTAFQNQTIRTVVVRNWSTQDFLYLVFLRLNTGSVPLSPQELRQALLPGPFTDFLDDFTSESTLLQEALRAHGPDKRMRDVEVLLRFYAFDSRLKSYKGNLKPFLDDTATHFNRLWPTTHEAITDRARACEEAISTTFDIFGERSSFVRWNVDHYESQFNRAIWDIMTFYFKYQDVAMAARQHRQELVSGFQSLCTRDQEFVRSIQTTTKSITAIRIRLQRWRQVLLKTLDLPVPQPSLPRAA